MQYQDIISAATATIAKIWTAHSGRTQERFFLQLSGETCGIAPYEPGDTTGHYGWRLQMPAIPLDAPMTRVDIDTFAAQMVHEISHPLYTDFGVWAQAVREGLGYLVNCLEDVRIERRAIDAPVAVNARELLAAHSDRQVAQVLAKGWDPADPQHLPYAFKAYGRQRLNGYALPSLPPLPAAIAARWDWVFAELAACQSTQDVLRLARKITRRAPEQPGQPGQPGEGEGEGEGEGTQGEGEGTQGEGEGTPGEGEGTPGEGEGTPGGQAPVDAPVDMGEGKGEGGSGTSAYGSGKFREFDDDMSAQVAAILRRSRTAGFNAGVENEITALGRARPVDFKTLALDGFGKGRLSGLAALIPNTAKLQADVRRLVKAPERVGVTRALTSGRFDRRGFTRAQAGAQNVFARKHYEPGVNAAVSLVLDASSSMGERVTVNGGIVRGAKAKAAAALALAMGDALDRAKTPFEVCYAQSGHSAPLDPVYSKSGRTFMVKGFNEPWTPRRERLGHAYNDGGTNNLGATWSAAARLLQVPHATRRIVFVLSDGNDTCTTGAWRRAIAILAKRGVEVVGVGLLHDVSHSFPVYLNVSDPAELATKGLGLLARQLERAAG